MADEYDKRRMQSIRDAQFRAAARASAQGHNADADILVAVCEASDVNNSTELIKVFDFISPSLPPSLSLSTNLRETAAVRNLIRPRETEQRSGG